MIQKVLRCTLGIFSGNIYFDIANKPDRRVWLVCFFTGGFVDINGIFRFCPFSCEKTTPGRLRSPRGCYKNDLLFQEIRLFSLALSQTRQVWSLVT